MTRKDIILISVVVNAGLLAVLFATAIIYDPGKALKKVDPRMPLAEAMDPLADASLSLIAASGRDEVDRALSSYTYTVPADIFINEPIVDEEEDFREISTIPSEGFVQVLVKKGDVLDRIARANGTTVNAIKEANHLKSERLSVGQVLKIPLKRDEPQVVASQPITKPAENLETQYYVVKSGDNPWKIAKQFNVSFEEIVRLNHLDEERARNLKIGDKIRIK